MDIADAQYVSITSFRANGKGVSNPVWISDQGDGTLGFTTASASHKVARLRNDPRITLTPCDIRGKVETDADTLSGTATVVTGTAFERVRDNQAAKYGVQFTAMGLLDKAGKLLRKGSVSDVGVVITPESHEV